MGRIALPKAWRQVTRMRALSASGSPTVCRAHEFFQQRHQHKQQERSPADITGLGQEKRGDVGWFGFGLTGELVTQGGREKPDAHDRPNQFGLCELRHGAAADRAQAEFAKGLSKKSPTIHPGLPLPSGVNLAAGTMRTKESPEKYRPIVNFRTLEGWR